MAWNQVLSVRSGFLKDGSGKRVDVIAAVVASVSSAACHAMVLALHLCILAVDAAIRPAFL